MSASEESSDKLRLATCGACKANQWIPGNTPRLDGTPCSKCGHPVIIPFPIRQYEMRQIIASGGMGTVYRAFDKNLEREVAIKLVKKEVAQDPQVMDSFYREARAGAALNHTNIIHVYEFDDFEGQPYLVVELADSGSVDQRIDQHGALSELEVLDVGIAIASALETALVHDFLHRDIKPGNILFNADNVPKLVDFGLARHANDDVEQDSAVWGTPYYVAPEKIQRQGETFHSDMYSLGGTLYHALTGKVPFEAETVEEVIAGHVHTPLTPPNHVRPEVSQPTSEAIANAMAKAPEERYATYADLIMALEAARSQLLVNKFRGGQASRKATSAKPWWKR